MINENLYNLFSKSDKYYMRLMSGKSLGRQLHVWDIFKNYFEHFTAMGMNLFTYETENNYVPTRFFKQLEKRLFYFGHVGVVKRESELVAVSASGFDEDIYNEPVYFNFTFGGGMEDPNKTPDEREINKDGVYCKNTFTGYPTAMIAEQYALMIAHCDMSIIAELVNSRFMDLLKAGNNQSAEAAGKFYKDLYNGKLSFISDKTQELEVDRSGRNISRLHDYTDTKASLLKEFYALFGINKTNEKRERMIKDEVKDNQELLMFNIKDMLDQRQKMCDDIRNVFDINIKVKCHIDIDNNGIPEDQESMGGDTNEI